MKNRGPNDKIRGKNKSFVSVHKAVNAGIRTEDDVDAFRDICKDSVALRMKKTAHRPFAITPKCIEVIFNAFGDGDFSHCIRCTLEFFNMRENDKKHLAEINYDACCLVKDPGRSIQHAKQDCLRCIDIIEKEKIKWVQKGRGIETSKRFEVLSESLKFCSEFISFLMTTKNAPKKLSIDLFHILENMDGHCANLYALENNSYKLVSNLRKCSQDLLTTLFCFKYKYIAIQ